QEVAELHAHREAAVSAGVAHQRFVHAAFHGKGKEVIYRLHNSAHAAHLVVAIMTEELADIPFEIRVAPEAHLTGETKLVNHRQIGITPKDVVDLDGIEQSVSEQRFRSKDAHSSAIEHVIHSSRGLAERGAARVIR